MSNNWDFYFCNVENKLASIFLDLALSAPQSDRPDMAYLRLYMRKPREDGLSSQEEYAVLTDIETVLGESAAESNAVYVGRNTTDGFRDYVFYAANGMACEKHIAAALVPFQGYHYETGSRPDPDWSIYREFLYPSPKQRQVIENRRTYDTLERNGDSLTKAREIDHWAYFTDVQSRSRFIEICGEQGFQVRKLHDPNQESSAFGVQIFRIDTPNRDQFDEIVLQLFDLASTKNGEYDGWEAQVIK